MEDISVVSRPHPVSIDSILKKKKKLKDKDKLISKNKNKNLLIKRIIDLKRKKKLYEFCWVSYIMRVNNVYTLSNLPVKIFSRQLLVY